MIIVFNLIYNFNLSWIKQSFSRGYKLLHVFWNTLYILVEVCFYIISGLLCPLWLLAGTPAAIRPELAFRRAEHSWPYSGVAKYILIYYINFITYAVCVLTFMTSPLDVAGRLLSI